MTGSSLTHRGAGADLGGGSRGKDLPTSCVTRVTLSVVIFFFFLLNI